MANLAPTLERFATGTYTVTRRTAAAPVGGRAQAPTTTTVASPMVVEPLSGNDLLRLSEGQRAEEKRTVYSPVELRIVGAGREADSISIDGADWEVEDVEDWSASGNYWKATVRRV